MAALASYFTKDGDTYATYAEVKEALDNGTLVYSVTEDGYTYTMYPICVRDTGSCIFVEFYNSFKGTYVLVQTAQ